MATWRVGDLEIEMLDGPERAGAAAPSGPPARELALGKSQFVPSSVHRVTCRIAGEEIASVVVTASGGRSGVHPHSCVMLRQACAVAVGPFVACLGLPELQLLWSAEVDWATCFGLFPADAEGSLICHGELSITRLSPDGVVAWSETGADIFTGEFSILGGEVLATDFNGDRYRFDIHTGAGVLTRE